jgi:hypothetical protein
VQLGDLGTTTVGLDCIWHNMYTGTNVTTVRKLSTASVDQMLIRVARHVEDGLYTIISLNMSKHSFVAVCAFNKNWEDMPDGWFADPDPEE